MSTRQEVDLQQLSVRRERAAGAALAPPRRIVSRYVVPGGLIAGFVAVLGWAARDAYLPRKPVTVVPVLASLSEVQTAGTPLFKAAGWVEPRPTPIRVTALAPGVIEELLVVEDQAVEAGQPIARLVSADARLALEQAEATVRLRQAEVDQAQAALTAAKTNFEVPAHLELPVAEAEAQLAALQTDLTNLPNQLARSEARLRLAKIDLESKQAARNSLPAIVIERAQSEFDAAQAEVTEMQQRRPVLEQQRDALIRRRDAAARRLELKTDEQQALGVARARLCAAEAQFKAAEVVVSEAQLRLSRMTIPAPVSGRVLELIAAQGTQLMTAPALMPGRDGNTVVTMYRPDQLQVRVDVRFEDLPRVGREQPVLVESPALGRPLEGRVLFLTGFANIQKNTLAVKVSLEDAPDVLKPEMLVDVTFLAPESPAAEKNTAQEYRVFVPRSLVETGEGGSFVWVADRTERVARRRAVTVGQIQTPTMVEITGGLTEATDLIDRGRDGLRDGDRIEISEESDAGSGAGGAHGAH